LSFEISTHINLTHDIITIMTKLHRIRMPQSWISVKYRCLRLRFTKKSSGVNLGKLWSSVCLFCICFDLRSINQINSKHHYWQNSLEDLVFSQMVIYVKFDEPGSHRSLKTWKVLEFENLDSRPGKSWNLCRGRCKSWNLDI